MPTCALYSTKVLKKSQRLICLRLGKLKPGELFGSKNNHNYLLEQKMMNSEVTGTGRGHSSLKRQHPDDLPAKTHKRRRLSPRSDSTSSASTSSPAKSKYWPTVARGSPFYTPLPERRVQTTDLKQLIERQNLYITGRKSGGSGWSPSGKHHFHFAIAVKKYTQRRESILPPEELFMVLQVTKSWTIDHHWRWINLSTVLHSLTTAGVFVPIGNVRPTATRYQTRLLEDLLNAIIAKTATRDNPDAQGVTNILWALARMIDSGLKLRSLFEKVVAALMPYITSQYDQVSPQGISNLLWALAKLVQRGMDLTPQIKNAVLLLLPSVLNQRSSFCPQEVCTELWALATLVNCGLELGREVRHTLERLLLCARTRLARFDEHKIALMIQSLAKLPVKAQGMPEETAETTSLMLAHLDPANLSSNELTATLWAFVKLLDHSLPLTQKRKNVLRRMMTEILRRGEDLKLADIPILTRAVTTLVTRLASLVHTLEPLTVRLLSQIIKHRCHFSSRDIIELWCSLGKLGHHCPTLEPEIANSASALLPRSEWLRFQNWQIPRLFLVLATLARHNRLPAAGLATLVANTLAVINSNKMSFDCQSLTDLFQSISTLVSHRLPLTPGLKVAIFELLTPVKTRHADFNEQQIVKLLRSLTTLADSELELTQNHKQTVVSLLPHVELRHQPDLAASLLWSLARLVCKGLEMTATLELVIIKLLSSAYPHQTDFQPEQVIRMVWATAMLLEEGLPLTPIVKKVMVALVPRLDIQQINCSTHDVISLLWALGTMGALIKYPPAVLNDLACELARHSKLTRSELYMALWGLLACAVRCADSSESVQVTLYRLFTYAQTEPPHIHQEATTLVMAAAWLGLKSPVSPCYQPAISPEQSKAYDHLRAAFPELTIRRKESINQLPPADIYLPELATIIEVQGRHHFVGHDFITRNGSCLLKTRLYQKLGYDVIEIPANMFGAGQQKWFELLLPTLGSKMPTSEATQ